MNLTSDVIIFTDGSSRGNPGPGGFGAIVIAPKNYEMGIVKYEVTELGGREEHTTNNRMELRAAIEALSFVTNLPACQLAGRQLTTYNLQLFTDSSYLINGITKWVFGWQKNNWITTQKHSVENRDLWEALLKVVRGKNIEWKYVGGHIGVAGNMRCDEIATAFADHKPTKLYADVLENYSMKNILDIKHDVVAATKRSYSRARNGAKAYSYVSMVGGSIQTHKTWAECEKRVNGKAARYKKVLSAEEEKSLIEEWSRH